jgi:hypothetical protein
LSEYQFDLLLNDMHTLFIDSSHILRLDGDVPFLFLEVLPALRTGPLIHIHDNTFSRPPTVFRRVPDL